MPIGDHCRIMGYLLERRNAFPAGLRIHIRRRCQLLNTSFNWGGFAACDSYAPQVPTLPMDPVLAK